MNESEALGYKVVCEDLKARGEGEGIETSGVMSRLPSGFMKVMDHWLASEVSNVTRDPTGSGLMVLHLRAVSLTMEIATVRVV